ncbi:hypothetical protein CWRG_02021 [Chthonomonas calidirosea]|nr:hypothetical protein CWRG_02021 [Chthonomonas calidirosea]
MFSFIEVIADTPFIEVIPEWVGSASLRASIQYKPISSAKWDGYFSSYPSRFPPYLVTERYVGEGLLFT